MNSASETPQTVLIFEDRGFRFPGAAEARAGYLIGDFNQWIPQTLLLEKGDKGFSVTLSVPEGVYRFRAEIDGETRLDPGRLHEIVCCSHGVSSKIQVAMPKRQVTLRNKSKRPLELQSRSSVEWMRIEPETVTLPSSGKTDVTPSIFAWEPPTGPEFRVDGDRECGRSGEDVPSTDLRDGDDEWGSPASPEN